MRAEHLDPEIRAWMCGDEEGAHWRGKVYLVADTLRPVLAGSLLLHELGERWVGADDRRAAWPKNDAPQLGNQTLLSHFGI